MRWDAACKASPHGMAFRNRLNKGMSVITSSSDYFMEIQGMRGPEWEKSGWKGPIERIKIKFDDWQPVTDAMMIGENTLIRRLASLVNKDARPAKPATGEDSPKQGPTERTMGLAALLKEANKRLDDLRKATYPLDSIELSGDNLVKCLDEIIVKATALRIML